MMSHRPPALPTRWRIRHQTVVPFAALIVLTIGLTAAATIVLLNRYADRSIDQALSRMLRMVTTTGSIFDAAMQANIKETLGADVITSDADGTIVSTTLPGADWDPETGRQIHALIRAEAPPSSSPRTVEVQGMTYRVLRGSVRRGGQIAFVTLLMPLSEVNRTKRQVAWAVVAIASVGIVLSVVVGSAIARTITTPIERLASATRELADGNWQSAPEVRGAGEVVELASAFGDMTERLRHAREELVQAERLATAGQLAATFAHEVRNPLSAIKLMLQLAAESTDDETIVPYIRNSLEEGDRLNGIVEGMLDFSRPAPLTKLPCDLADVVEREYRIVSERFADRPIRFACDVRNRPRVVVDAHAVGRAIANLLVNAVEAQPDGGEVSVSLDTQSASCVVEIADRGPGIEPDVARELFRPFFTTKARGSGLGLVTSRRCVELHGGSLRVENRLDGGARAVIELPIEGVP